MIAAFAFPIAAAITYFIIRKQRWQTKPALSWKAIAILLLEWLGMTLCVTVIITILVNDNIWIVHQATGGWEHFLNGLEYVVFGVLLAIIPILLVLAGELLIWIARKMKERVSQS